MDFASNIATLACAHYSGTIDMAAMMGVEHLSPTHALLEGMLLRAQGRLNMVLEKINLTR